MVRCDVWSRDTCQRREGEASGVGAVPAGRAMSVAREHVFCGMGEVGVAGGGPVDPDDVIFGGLEFW